MKKANKIGKPEKADPIKATSKQPLKIELGTIFQKSVRSKNAAERKIIGQAINAARDAWGNPHLHAGAGIRRLRRNFFECRSGLKTRLVFEWMDEGILYFHLAGNHNEIHRFLKRHG